MTWTFDQVLLSTYGVVKANFATFLAVALVVDLPLLAVELVDANDYLVAIVSFLMSVVSSVAMTAGTLQALTSGAAHRFHPMLADVADAEAVAAALEPAIAAAGLPTILVNNAGYTTPWRGGRHDSCSPAWSPGP
jgi:NAD(P)-dependent dehydrogenase (short-subunit alcohol dehydrogenase family)